jgi:hypothetical protein
MNAKLFVLIFLVLTASGCNFLNPIKQVECKITKILSGKPSYNIGQKKGWIFNDRTGVFYIYDNFTEKLRLPQKDEEENGWIFNTKSTIINDKWKKEEIGTYLKDGRKAKTYVEINLKTMTMEFSKFTYGLGWEKTWGVSGVCEWKKPKTTIS